MKSEGILSQSIERRIKLLQSEIGNPKGKRILIAVAGLSEADKGVVKKLDRLGADLRMTSPQDPLLAAEADVLAESLEIARPSLIEIEAAEADVVIFVGDFSAKLVTSLGGGLRGQKVCVFHEIEGDPQELLDRFGAKSRRLEVKLTEVDIEKNRQKDIQENNRKYWILAVALLITLIGITNAMLMSVTERVREIGTMKCLGALSSFVVKLFLIECSLVGFSGSVLGGVLGVLFSLLTYSYQFGLIKVFVTVNYGALGLLLLVCVVVGVVLSIAAGIYPAKVAAKMIPAAALATHV